MAYASDQSSSPGRRRVALRAVPPTPHVLTAEPVGRLAPEPEEQSFLETIRKLWRRRGLIALCTLVLGGAAIVAAWSMPSYFVSEARVLVGVQLPRLPNVESLIADVSPDAERVQNEGFILQSRNIARQVIDQLRLRDDPEFNPTLRKPSFWSRLNLQQYVPPAVDAWIAQLTSAKPKAADADKFTGFSTGPGGATNEDRMIDTLLSRVDVSTLGRSHVLSIKAESQNPATAAAIANALAERYLDYQRRDKIESMDRVDKFLLGRVAELRQQVTKSDQAVEDYRRSHDLYKSAGSGVTAQQLNELNTQLTAAQTAKAEAESRLNEAQEMRKGGLNSESVPEVLRSPLIAVLKEQLATSERKTAELSAAYGARHPTLLNSRAETANIQNRVGAEVSKIVDGLAREARTANARYEAIAKNFETLKKQMGAVNDRSIQLEIARARCDGQPQSSGSDAAARQAEHGGRDHPAGQRQAGFAGRPARRAKLSAEGSHCPARSGRRHDGWRRDRPAARGRRPHLPPRRADRGCDRTAGHGRGAADRRPYPAGDAGAATADIGLQRSTPAPSHRRRAVRSGRFAQDHPVQLGDAVGRQVGDGRVARPAARQQRQARAAYRLRLAQPAAAPDLPLRQPRRPG